jgi:hypothetical protein
MWLALALSACLEEGTPHVPTPLAVVPSPVHVPVVDIEVPAPPRQNDHPVCEAWSSAIATVDDTGWSGSVASCEPGDPAAGYLAGLPMLAFARSLVGLPPVDAGPGPRAQACAVAMHANDAITHHPPEEWACVSPEVADTAAVALLANLPADDSVLAYLVDPGNADTLGHRRWLLSPWLYAAEIGSTDTYSCLELAGIDQTGPGPDWIAWPPPGAFPREMLELHGHHVDTTGWSIQSDSLDLAAAVVTVTIAGATYPVEPWSLVDGLGSASAIAFRVDDLPPADSYTVTVDGVAEPFAYTVDLVDCMVR